MNKQVQHPLWADVDATPSRGAQLVVIGSVLCSVVVFGLAASGVALLALYADLPRPLALIAVVCLVAHAFGRLGAYEIIQGRLKLRAYIRRVVAQA